MYKIITSCRACGYGTPAVSGIKSQGTNERLIRVANLGVQPLANDFVSEGATHAGFAPLEVMYCPKCTNAQLSVVVQPDILYRNYAYVTSPSATMAKHFSVLHEFLFDGATNGKRVLEIGSNDGRLLHFLQQKGHAVCGIDPAENLQPDAVPSICDVLCYGSAEAARLRLAGPADIVIARHVFCHVDDWLNFFKSLEVVTHANSKIAIEVPYVGKLLDRVEFDTIYHEHLDYVSYKAIVALLARTSFQLVDIGNFDIHGGSVVLVIRHRDSGVQPSEKTVALIGSENISEDRWRNFAISMQKAISEMQDLIRGFASMKKSVCVFGASAKSTVMLNCCRFTRKEIQFICDCTKGKWFKSSPGSDIPVYDEGALLRELPDYAIMSCWNFQEEVLLNQKVYTDQGGKFIIPIPNVQIVP